MDEPEQDDPVVHSRRALLSKVAGAGCLALAAGVMTGPTGVGISPLVKKTDDAPASTEPRWYSVGAVTSFELGKPRRVVLRRDVRDAWLVARDVAIGVVLVTRLDDVPTFRVLSAVCPHLGCSVSARGDEWFCPCHDSSFAADGSLMPGRENPSPRGLDALPARVAGSVLEVQWRRFRTGTAEQKEIG